MALQQLDAEQVRTMTREEKDRWWLTNIYRGDMPQLTLRAGITGFLLGGVLSATNLYVGAKTGWTLGVGLTSVILAFALFKAASSLKLAGDFTILENNAMQSIATSAGYMTAPLVSSLAAYMMIEDQTIPWPQIMGWNIVLSVLGVLVAFPMKRRFINDEQQPFPEGRACGVVLDTLYTADAAIGIFKARTLAIAAGIAGLVQFLLGEAYQTFVQIRVPAMLRGVEPDPKATPWHLPEQLDGWYYRLAAENGWWMPNIAGIDLRQLALRPTLDLAMIGAGGLMGTRVTTSLLVGALLNFAVIAPWMIHAGEILPKSGTLAAGDAVFGRPHILNTWALWWGISAMVVASIVGLFAKPKLILSAFSGLRGAKRQGEDVLGHIELPLSYSFVGVPIVGAVALWMGHAWFGVLWWHGALALVLIFLLTLIAANSTALTSITPTGSLSKITQFSFGALDPVNPATNLMTAGMTAEIASNASNLLMDIKPGYMLGAKPRQQAIAHVIGIFSGALASTPLFFVMFIAGHPEGTSIEERLISDKFGFPGAIQWKGVADLISKGVASLPDSAVTAMIVAGVAALAMEVARIVTRNRFPLSPLAIGLGVVIPPESTIVMFAGAMFFWAMGRRHPTAGTPGHRLWVDTLEPICAGLIAGAALIGIGDKLVQVFLLG